MSRYIDADKLSEMIEARGKMLVEGKEAFYYIANWLNKLPPADVAEVKHGEWELFEDCANAGVYCTVCHKKVYREYYANVKPKSKYCPNCGARMDGGANDEM